MLRFGQMFCQLIKGIRHITDFITGLNINAVIKFTALQCISPFFQPPQIARHEQTQHHGNEYGQNQAKHTDCGILLLGVGDNLRHVIQ